MSTMSHIAAGTDPEVIPPFPYQVFTSDNTVKHWLLPIIHCECLYRVIPVENIDIVIYAYRFKAHFFIALPYQTPIITTGWVCFDIGH